MAQEIAGYLRVNCWVKGSTYAEKVVLTILHGLG